MSPDLVGDSTVVAADRDTILTILRDVEGYPSWQNDLTQADVLERDAEGRPAKAAFTFKGAMFTAHYTVAYSYTDSGMSWTLIEGDILKEMDGSYDVADRGDGTSEVTYKLAVSPGIKIPAILKRQGAKRMIDNALVGLKERVEEG